MAKKVREALHFSFTLSFLQIIHTRVLCKLEGERTLPHILSNPTITEEQERELSRLQRAAVRIGQYLETELAPYITW
jgi:hypothetical protein